MLRSPDSTTDTYLDICRTLGVPDAALRRHHDARPETPLRVAIDGDCGTPTADLLSVLEATGRLLDLRDGLTVDGGDRLTGTLARFGLLIECVDPAGGSDGVELVVYDTVTAEIERIATESDPASVEAAFREELPNADAIVFAELLDGRHLVADPRELRSLAERYGPRLQPFDDPLLVSDDAIELEDRAGGQADPSPSDASGPGPASEAARGDGPTRTPPSEPTSPSASTSPSDDSFGEFVSAVDDSATEAVESALATDDSSGHTIEDDGEDVASAASTAIGGGPRRTVSTSGIDEVFDQLESDTPEDAASATTRSTPESADPPTDPTTPSEDDSSDSGLSGGPTRTVSTTSADDILEQATGASDFEAIAAEEGDADPTAVLADAEGVPPALEDADVAAELASGSGGPDSGPGDVTGADEIDDDLIDADAELRRGGEPLDRPAAPDASAIDVDPDESADADGPLAAAGGVPRPDDASDGTEEIAESVETEEHAGLVGRLTSSIFGR